MSSQIHPPRPSFKTLLRLIPGSLRDPAEFLLSLARDYGDLTWDECISMLPAGHHPVAKALTRTWYLLSQNPESEERLHSEIDSLLGDRLPQLEDLERGSPILRAYSERRCAYTLPYGL